MALIFVFTANADAMIATKALKDQGLLARMMPTPALAGERAANLCLSLDESLEARACGVLDAAKVQAKVFFTQNDSERLLKARSR